MKISMQKVFILIMFVWLSIMTMNYMKSEHLTKDEVYDIVGKSDRWTDYMVSSHICYDLLKSKRNMSYQDTSLLNQCVEYIGPRTIYPGYNIIQTKHVRLDEFEQKISEEE